MKLNIVFDIDSCLTEAIRLRFEEGIAKVEKQLGKEMADDLIITAYGYPHRIFPGFYALWEWLHKQGITIMIFSTGIKERNVEFVDKFAKRSFRNIKEEDRPEIKVFSRTDTFDTERYRNTGDRDKYQSCWFGNLKKVLKNVVVSEEELPYTLLVDDDRSYVGVNEERNLVYVPSGIQYYPENPGLESGSFYIFHKAFYLCGILKKIMAVAEEKNLTPVMAAEYVQATMEGEEINRDFYFPATERMEYYNEGLKTLQELDPSLKFFFPPLDSEM